MIRGVVSSGCGAWPSADFFCVMGASLPQATRNQREVLAAITVGVCMAVTCSVFGLYVSLLSEQTRVGEIHSKVAPELRGMVEDSTRNLRRANKVLPPDCSADTLKTLRRWLLASGHIAEFGILDGRGRLLCTTTDGVLNHAIEMGVADIVYPNAGTGEIFGIHLNTNLNFAASGMSSTSMSLGHFNALYSPFRFQELRFSGISALRMFLPGKGSALAYRAPDVSNSTIMELAAKTPVEGRQTGVSLATATSYVSSAVADTPYVIQSVIKPEDVLRHHWLLIVAFGILTVIIGVLTYLVSLPLIRRRNSIDSRINRLLQQENIHCVFQPVHSLAACRTFPLCEIMTYA